MSDPRNFDCDVLVVGAGPSGLIAAILLVRSGARVRIVERRLDASHESRAFAVQARTLELMHSIGLSEAFLARGAITNGIDIHVQGKRRGGLDLDRAAATDTLFPFILMIPQSETEAILIEELERLGVTVERGAEFSGMMQDSDSVVSSITFGNSKTTLIRSHYLVGADGSRSAVRTAADLSWTGDAYPQRFLLADCKVDWPLDHHRFRVFLNGPRIGLFLPLDGANVSRVMATDFSEWTDEGDATVPAPLDLAEIESGMREATGLDVKLSEPVWVTRYRAHHRSVGIYRADRVFVAGDAAHIHSPAGGQGMNTGLQDAANLAWKLALALEREVGDGLLDSYDEERRAVGEQVVRSTGKLFNAAAGQAGWKSAVRDNIAKIALPLVSKLPLFHRKGFWKASQRDVAYPEARYVSEGSRRPSHGPAAGARVPNVRVREGLELHSLIAGYQFQLLVMSRRFLDAGQLAETGKSAQAALGDFNATVHIISRSDRGASPLARIPTSPEIFDQFGLRQMDDQALYLVRPDGYIAWRCSQLDFAALQRFVKLFGEKRATKISVSPR
jgi:2-polyprenyl-6-methoxyphenol hydroxylase-like FAD-dependent oxidoreductase